MEAGETHLDALHRELLEEAGLRGVAVVADLGVQERQNYARTRWQVTRYFLGVTEEEAVTPLEPGFSLEWHPLEAVPELFWPEQTRLVDDVRRGLAAGRWALEARKKGRPLRLPLLALSALWPHTDSD